MEGKKEKLVTVYSLNHPVAQSSHSIKKVSFKRKNRIFPHAGKTTESQIKAMHKELSRVERHLFLSSKLFV